ncbi:conserved hypothetical protein [Theileria orientalis strain Shintoku]|uniref:Uncharacterized protein n=1 Tax=Theileria orientalis strain Shintoku TaxID=869250 RepID=J4DNL5_THEOR|nr:conserved hypothetical protein [Theileria orientalis strain Shintoku]BAM39169.1 conserved hypothetical protein [Theileria orientalis strain Shintoku]|eukprot:XP_009689470.1 conserved hypothetical protein [Theileria orientalis strain Shintoku]
MILKRCFGFIPRTNNKIANFDICAKNGHQLSQIVRVASQRRWDDEKLWSLIKTRLQYISGSLSARNLSFIANGFSRAGFREASDWDAIVSRTYELSENLSNQEIALLFNAMCKVEGLDPKVFGVLVEQIKVLAIKLHDPTVMRILLKSIKNNLNTISLISISSVINGFYHLNNFDVKVMIQLIDPINKILETDRKIEMKTIVSIYQGYCHSGIYDRELYNKLFEYMIENSGKLKLVEMIIVSSSMNTSKLHNGELIEIMNKKLTKRPKLYDYDGISMYLTGLMNNKYVPKGSVEKLMDQIGHRKYKGSLNVKNSTIFLQIMSKFHIVNEKLYEYVIGHLMASKDQLTQSDLSSIICCCNCIDKEDVNVFIELFFETFDRNHSESAHHLSRILYSLVKLNRLEFERHIERILGNNNHIYSISEVVNVVNTLYSLEKIEDSQPRADLLKRMISYVNRNMNKFSHQLLASTLGSLTKMKRVDDETVNEFCKNPQVFDGNNNVKDNLKLLEFLNTHNYFKEIGDEDLVRIMEAYKIIMRNIASCDVDSECDDGENSNKLQLGSPQEEVIQEAHNILNTIGCKVKVRNKVDGCKKEVESREKGQRVEMSV